jgi:hypothetical protein
MFGKKGYLKTLETRKQEILARSDVNRVELLNDWETIKTELQRVKKHLRAAGSIASSAMVLAAAASVFRRKHEPPKTENHTKVPWVAAALNGARVGASLFMKLRSLKRERR